MKAGYTYLWEFMVEPDRVEEFQRLYGPDGPWVALFRRSPGYLDTWLLRDRADPRRFITVDRWKSVEAHHAFRSEFAREYAELDGRCAHLSSRETQLGEFTETP
jgi:heme-degrading monooxygenase HmoA